MNVLSVGPSRSSAACVSLALVLAAHGAWAQAVAAATTAVVPATPSLHVSPVMGFNFAIDYTAQHNSATGWANVVTPDLSYRWNRYLSVDASLPWYATIKAFVPVKSGTTIAIELGKGHSLLGDTDVSGHLELAHQDLSYMLTTTVGFATGNTRYGLSANTTTYNFTNHFDYSLGPFTPDIEFGEGDNSTLANQTVRRIYTAVGPLANFQAGSSIDLPWNLSLDLEAYEELPIGNQNVYGTVTKKSKKGKTVMRQVLEGTGAAEDNGFTGEFDIPLGRYVVVNGSYARSLIQGLDTASLGITWTIRAPKVPNIH
jgi:hypothetical protein